MWESDEINTHEAAPSALAHIDPEDISGGAYADVYGSYDPDDSVFVWSDESVDYEAPSTYMGWD